MHTHTEGGLGGHNMNWPQRVEMPVAHQEVTSGETRARDVDLGGCGLGGSLSHGGRLRLPGRPQRVRRKRGLEQHQGQIFEGESH